MSTPPILDPARYGPPANDHGLRAGLAAVPTPAGRPCRLAAAVLSRRSAARSMAPSAGEAAAVPVAATTALRGIRDVGEVTAGQRVLVTGASGGVGTYAVQIAAALGAEVAAVCSTRNVELVRSIGAAHVIDYTTDDFTDGPARYDVIFDNVSNLPLSRLRGALTPKGTW